MFLDALRGIAAMFVVAFHLPKVLTGSFNPNGPLAVDFFFCLSGFVIAFSYEKRLTQSISFKDFAVARWIRLYPIYLLGSLVGLVLGFSVARFVVHLDRSWSSQSTWVALFTLSLFLWPTRLSPVHGAFNYPLDDPAWSLFFEIVANLVYALLVKLRMARTSLLLCIVGASLVLLAKIVVGGGGLDLGSKPSTFGSGFARVAFSFSAGVLICRIHQSRSRHRETHKTHWLLSVLISLVLGAVLSAPFSWMHSGPFHLLAIAVCFPAMVYFGALAQLPHSFNRLATVLGELSYPLYLLHLPFVELLTARHIVRFGTAHPTILHFLVPCMIAVFAWGAWQVGEHIDLPVRRTLTRRYNAYKLKPTAISLQPPAIPQHERNSDTLERPSL